MFLTEKARWLGRLRQLELVILSTLGVCRVAAQLRGACRCLYQAGVNNGGIDPPLWIFGCGYCFSPYAAVMLMAPVSAVVRRLEAALPAPGGRRFQPGQQATEILCQRIVQLGPQASLLEDATNGRLRLRTILSRALQPIPPFSIVSPLRQCAALMALVAQCKGEADAVQAFFVLRTVCSSWCAQLRMLSLYSFSYKHLGILEVEGPCRDLIDPG